MKCIIIYIFLYSTFAFAQNFKLGFDLQMHQVFTNSQSGSGNLGDIEFGDLHLFLSEEPLNDFLLEFAIGRALQPEFAGWEFGLNGQYQFYKSVFLSIGILEHSNEGGTLDNEVSLSYATIFLMQTGIGIQASRIFSAKVDYYLPFSQKVIGKRLNYSVERDSIFEPYKFRSMIRLSLIFGWEI